MDWTGFAVTVLCSSTATGFILKMAGFMRQNRVDDRTYISDETRWLLKEQGRHLEKSIKRGEKQENTIHELKNQIAELVLQNLKLRARLGDKDAGLDQDGNSRNPHG